MAEYNGKQGVWRTVGGRRIFIVDGEDLSTSMKNSGKFDNKEYKLSENEIEQAINESVSEWDEDYARLYITKINPESFLKLTTNEEINRRLENERFDLDLEKISNKKYVADMMYLDIDMETGEVYGHEGRHRMMALKNSGYNKVDLIIFPHNYDKYHSKEYTNKKIYSQEGIITNESVSLDKIVPISKRNKERIRKRDF